MKKILDVFICIVLLTVCTSCAFDIPEFEFKLNKDKKSYTLVEYNYMSVDASKTVKIPSTYNDLPVTKIASKAFYSCDKITSVQIPDTVTSIGAYAFYHCTKLTDVKIPKSVFSIEEYAFEGCNSLKKIVLSQEVEIGFRSFYDCDNLKTIEIGISEGISCAIGDYSFAECKKLETVTLGNLVTKIGERAFSDCVSLKTINFTNNMDKIGASAFAGCIKLSIINYSGTQTEWNEIDKSAWWDKNTGNYTVNYKKA